jgi:hypothetical protein
MPPQPVTGITLFYFTLLGQNTLVSKPFSNALSLCSSVNVKGQVSHPYKTAGNIKFCVF